MRNLIGSALAVVAAQALCISVAMADDFRNREPWDFKVRRNATATARATTMWQVDQLSRSSAPNNSAGQGSASGGAAGSTAGVSSVANMNVITIVVGDGGTADVAIETEQANQGKVDGTAVAIGGGAIDIGTIK